MKARNISCLLTISLMYFLLKLFCGSNGVEVQVFSLGMGKLIFLLNVFLFYQLNYLLFRQYKLNKCTLVYIPIYIYSLLVMLAFILTFLISDVTVYKVKSESDQNVYVEEYHQLDTASYELLERKNFFVVSKTGIKYGQKSIDKCSEYSMEGTKLNACGNTLEPE